MTPLVTPVQQVDFTFFYIIGISTVILLGVTATMIFFVIRYQRQRHPIPADIRGNWQLELLWTVIPTAIALSMFYYGWNSYISLRNVPPGAIEIQVEGQTFSWIFTYPNGKETMNDLVVPQGKPIKLNISSSDVIHSFYIPAFRVKVDAVPGMDTYAWFYPDKVGNYVVLCAEYCGTGHSGMVADLRIVTPEEYEKWLKEEEDDEDEDEDADDEDEE